MANLLLDTDVCIDHLRGHRRFRPGSDRLSYSVVTLAELFAGGNEREVVELLSSIEEIPVDRDIAARAGRVRRRAGLRLPDAMIAATALERRLTLVTRNQRDFKRVRGLRLRLPK